MSEQQIFTLLIAAGTWLMTLAAVLAKYALEKYERKRLRKSLKQAIYGEMDDISIALSDTCDFIKSRVKRARDKGGLTTISPTSFYDSHFVHIFCELDEKERRSIQSFYSHATYFNSYVNQMIAIVEKGQTSIENQKAEMRIKFELAYHHGISAILCLRHLRDDKEKEPFFGSRRYNESFERVDELFPKNDKSKKIINKERK